MSASDPRQPLGPPERLGPLLVRLRSARGLAQKDVARLAEIDNSTLSRLESGERGVSPEVLDRLSAVLSLNPRERLDILVAAGRLTSEAAQILADDDVSRLARVLHDPAVAPEHAAILRQYLALALAHARAMGYDPG